MSFAGAPLTFVNFWGTWCPPCLRELPDLVRAAQRYDGRVRFVGVAVGDSPLDDIVSVATKNDVPYALYRSDDDSAWNTVALPSSFIVDGNGVVRWSVRGGESALDLDVAFAHVLDHAPAVPGEIALANAVAVRDDVVVTTRDVIGDSALVAVSRDGTVHDVVGSLADDGETGLALLKIDTSHGALAPIAFANGDAAVAFAMGVRASDEDGAETGAALVDDKSAFVALKLADSSVPAGRVRELLGRTKLDAPPKHVGPDVHRNVTISAIFFGAIALAFVLPLVVGRVRRRAAAKSLAEKRRGWTAH